MTWHGYALTDPICRFRFPIQKFGRAVEPILYPAQIMTGGGRGKGFRVEKYLEWWMLPTLKHTEAWNSILVMYDRLGNAFCDFYEVLGFLTPRVKDLVLALQESYADSYRTSPFQEYAHPYASVASSGNVAGEYSEVDYAEVYSSLSINKVHGVDTIE